MEDEDYKITSRSLDDYAADPENANEGSERGNKMIKDSVERFKAGRSLLADKDGMLIAGNKTREAALAAGLTKVIEVETDGDALIVHRRRDLDLDDPDNLEARLLAYYDNRTSQVSLTWAAAQLMKDKERGVALEELFSSDELRSLIQKAVETEGEPPAPQNDKIDQVHAKWNAVLGDLWVIPSLAMDGVFHRLVCGDSTDATAVQRALGDHTPLLCVTDPPYGVEYAAEWRDEVDQQRGRNQDHALRSAGRVLNDDRVDWSDALVLFPGNVIYCWHAGVHAAEVAAMLEKINFQVRAQIIWAKDNLVMSRGHYHWQHEPCYYAVRKGASANWQGDRKQSTVWFIANMSATAKTDEEDQATGHGTQKPVEAMRRPIRNHTLPGDYVYEPFNGSGTTICAAEMTGRGCLAVELDPKYVSLTLQRLSDMGLEPKRVDDE